MLPRAGSSGVSCYISSVIICSIVTFVVGLMTFLIWCMWTMIFIGDFVRCLHTEVVVDPGQLLNQYFALDFIQVVDGMLLTHAWR